MPLKVEFRNQKLEGMDVEDELLRSLEVEEFSKQPFRVSVEFCVRTLSRPFPCERKGEKPAAGVGVGLNLPVCSICFVSRLFLKCTFLATNHEKLANWWWVGTAH